MYRGIFLIIISFSAIFFSFSETDSIIQLQPVINIENNIPDPKPTESVYSVIEKAIPLLGVLLGFILGILKEYFTRRREVATNGRGWTESFIQLEDPLKKQIREIEEFLENNPEDTYELTDFSLFEALEGYDFEEFNQSFLTSFLKRKKKMKKNEAIKLAGKLKANTRVIKSNFLKLSSFFTLLTENTAPHFQEFSNSLVAFRKIMAEYIDEISQSSSSVEQKTIADKIVAMSNSEIQPSIKDNTPLNVFRFSERFIRPFFELAYDDRYHPKMKQMVELLSQCDHSIMALKMERRYLRIKLGKVKASFDNNLEQVTELIEKI